MSVIAEAIVQQIRALPPAEQRAVFAGLEGILHTDDALLASRAEEEKAVASKKAEQLAAMHRLCGSSKGEGLLGKLLADRAKERARG